MKKVLNKDLNVSDYALEISSREIIETNLNFIESTDENNVPVITVELNGTDYDEYDAGISFDLYLSLDDLVDYSNTPTNITDKIIEGHSYVMRPSEEEYSELFIYVQKNTIEDMKNDLTSLWVAKIDNDNYMFKFSVPLEGVFTYFTINIKEFETQESTN